MSAPPRRQVVTRHHINLLTAHIDANISRRIKLNELSDLMGLSLFHFAREFKATADISPMRFVLGRRIVAAKLALTGTLSLAEIAIDTGFSSQAHFTTAFREATGVTPAVFRAGVTGLMLCAAFDWFDIVEFAMFPFW